MKKVKFLIRQIQRMRNILVILAMFVCTSICLGATVIIDEDIVNQNEVRTLELLWQQEEKPQYWVQLESLRKYSDIAGNGNPNKDPDKYKYGKALDGDLWNNPNNNHLIIKPDAKVGNAFGAKMNVASVQAGVSISMTNNKVVVSGGEFGCGYTNGDIAGAWADDDIADLMNVSLNTVEISEGVRIRKDVFGGYIGQNGTANGNRVTLTGVYVLLYVYGAQINGRGTASDNEVTINHGVNVDGKIYGVWIGESAGAVINNKVIINGGDLGYVYGAKIDTSAAAVINNVVTINDGEIFGDVYGAKIERVLKGAEISKNKVIIKGGKVTTGKVYGAWIATSEGAVINNEVTITGGEIRGNVYGAKITTSKGAVINNEVTITDGEIFGDVCGAKIDKVLKGAEISNNKVIINGGRVTGSVYGV